MPEPYWPKRKGSYSLLDADRQPGKLAQIVCRYCKRERYYELRDLRTALGNIEVDDVVYQMRCSQCRGDRTLAIEVVNPSAEDRQRMIIRRLVSVQYIRRPVWRDEGPS